MKKISKILSKLIVLVLWTFLYLAFFNKLVFIIWNFDFLSERSWQIFYNWFVNQNGIINTASDVSLLLTMLTIPLLWFVSCFFVSKIKLSDILLYPINKINNFFASKENTSPERIVIKNIKSDVKELEDLKTEMESFKPKKSISANSLRGDITKKITETKK